MARLSENDPHSFSNPEECLVTDIDLHLEVDFKRHILVGYVDLSIERVNNKADLCLDTRDLCIKSVKNKNTKNNINFVLGEPDKVFGSKLEIKLPKRGTKSVVRIEYQTSPNSSALMWLEPEQTADKKHPYMFSMCQAINARSMLPCQDTPNVKAGYRATITAPYEFSALMSAIHDGEEMADDPFMKNYKFVQKIPIPSYLIVLVIGVLESRNIGPRSHVWSEKSVLEKAAEEFSETEKMLTIAEKLLGEYVWEVYDILVLPPSFAYGGMENPCLTFVTPTLLAGDKSLAFVIAHEIAHSWSGNLVTNKNFEHFWLNEGFTTFFERKIEGRMHGEDFRQMESICGWMELEHDVRRLGENHNFTKLLPDLSGVDPDIAFCSVPYEKGHTLLFHLETILGVDEFENFLKTYIEEFKYKIIDTATWKKYLYHHFSDKVALLDKVDWDTWFYGTGMPPIKPDFDTSLLQKCIDLCKRWVDSTDEELCQFSTEDIKKFSSVQKVGYLSLLLEEKPLTTKKLQKLEEIYKLNDYMNSEIRFRWIRLGLFCHFKDILPEAVKFISEQGRCKFLIPIYVDMYNWEESRELAISTFKEHSKTYMHVVVQQLTELFHLPTDNSEDK